MTKPWKPVGDVRIVYVYVYCILFYFVVDDDGFFYAYCDG